MAIILTKILLGTVALYLMVRYVAPVFAPFIVAVFLSLLIDPVVNFLQNRVRLPRAVAVAVAMLAIFGSIGVILVLLVIRLIVELAHLSAFLPEYAKHIKTSLISIQNKAEDYYLALPHDVANFINERLTSTQFGMDSILDRAQSLTVKLLNSLLQLVSSVPGLIILIIISGIATYFMAKDKRVIVNFWLKVIPQPWGLKSVEITKEIIRAIISYVRAQSILITLTFTQSLIGLYMIGAPYALSMALVVGLADIIPILGPSSVFLPWIAWEFITGDSVFGMKPMALYIIVIVVRQVLETKIVSSSMGLHPLATLISMYVGLKLLGPLGVIAGPLFLITLKAFARAGLLGYRE